MAFEIKKGERGVRRQKFKTRDGRKVKEWWFVNRPHETFFPIRAVIENADGTTEEHPYNRNGRRYINVQSELDLVPYVEHKPKGHTKGLDTMPDVLKAIRCVRAKDMSGVRSANKIGELYEGATYADVANITVGGTL